MLGSDFTSMGANSKINSSDGLDDSLDSIKGNSSNNSKV